MKNKRDVGITIFPPEGKNQVIQVWESFPDQNGCNVSNLYLETSNVSRQTPEGLALIIAPALAKILKQKELA